MYVGPRQAFPATSGRWVQTGGQIGLSSLFWEWKHICMCYQEACWAQWCNTADVICVEKWSCDEYGPTFSWYFQDLCRTTFESKYHGVSHLRFTLCERDIGTVSGRHENFKTLLYVYSYLIRREKSDVCEAVQTENIRVGLLEMLTQVHKVTKRSCRGNSCRWMMDVNLEIYTAIS
jgi:hypothetical protein